jgi:hypothetical protein
MAIFLEELRERYPVTVYAERVGFPFVDPDAEISDFPLREDRGEKP